ncbi:MULTISPECIES: hypothetical protein [Pseudoalteromonas]|uniref:hypothetical protein n=1 Tax=Pseudoalteromonas TaxID=53246 RepID=UPI0015FA000B|nr:MULTISPECIES: hypothetical protein [unclassified Pseudoalteromonas]MBB1405431.1 hypothetical protein [Pseudoalteromonas sp. SG44-5]MBH0071811.1 hypothetical protein [Pseudoalteromonas sp. NZS127]MBH0092468.1 hypothetical protein [Pseudoalteromonas sp. SCQQ13]
MIKFLLLKSITFFAGCMSCFVMHTTFALPLVISAALTGLAGSFIPFPKLYQNHPYAAIYAGSFAGMCSTSLITSYWEVAIISIIGATLYTLTLNAFAGFGGRLGSVAFASVALYSLAKGLV